MKKIVGFRSISDSCINCKYCQLQRSEDCYGHLTKIFFNCELDINNEYMISDSTVCESFTDNSIEDDDIKH